MIKDGGNFSIGYLVLYNKFPIESWEGFRLYIEPRGDVRIST
jgi:hypothetical protein